ncbi:MAG: glutamate--cysteine ligase, partial [Pseudomonadota bacterium]
HDLRVASSIDGLAAEVNGVKIFDLAREAVTIADAGLRARAKPGAGGLLPDETHFLNALRETLETKETPADELIRRYNTDWNGDVTKVFGDYSY